MRSLYLTFIQPYLVRLCRSNFLDDRSITIIFWSKPVHACFSLVNIVKKKFFIYHTNFICTFHWSSIVFILNVNFEMTHTSLFLEKKMTQCIFFWKNQYQSYKFFKKLKILDGSILILYVYCLTYPNSGNLSIF